MFLAGLVAGSLTIGRLQDPQGKKGDAVDLGNFSTSLAVKDIRASVAFYEKLGFTKVAGDLEQKWIVLKSGTTKIGLFQGMFPRNTLTFNPGWNSEKEALKEFQDVREIQRVLKARGITFQVEADEKSEGPAFFSISDPDGNPILVDQHVGRPKR
jgi:lactoylglutathione lyase